MMINKGSSGQFHHQQQLLQQAAQLAQSLASAKANQYNAQQYLYGGNQLPSKVQQQPVKPQTAKPTMMTSTHQYYNAQHFWSKAEEEEFNKQGVGIGRVSNDSSPDTAAVSICMEDSFGDVIDNDTSERHIVIRKEPVPIVETPPKKGVFQAQLPHGLKGHLTSNHTHSSAASLKTQGVITQNSRQQASKNYSVAMPIPTSNAAAVTPGQKSAQSGKSQQSKMTSDQNPKHLHFIDKIQEETNASAIDGGNSVSTGPSNSGLDLIVIAPPGTSKNHSRQQKAGNRHPLYHTRAFGQATFSKTRPPYLDLRPGKQLSYDSMDGFVQTTRSKNEFHSKMDEFMQKKEDKLRKMREEKAQKEVENCVFSPQLATRKFNESVQRREFDQFMQDQMRFVETVRQKRELRQEEQENMEIAQVQHGPYVSHRSRQILMERQQRTQSREHCGLSDATGQYQNQNDTQTPFSGRSKQFCSTMKSGTSNLPPQSSKPKVKRDRNVEEILYQDAKRRQQSIESRQQEAIAKSHQAVPLVSRESQKLVIQRFERELNANIYELYQAQKEVNIEEMLKDEMIQLPASMNYLSMKLLMVRLGCCTEEQSFSQSSGESVESELLFEMWKYLTNASDLSSETDNDLPTDRLKLFAMVILRVAEPRILQDYLAADHHGFNFSDSVSLIKRFEQFYVNRLQALARVQIQRKAELEQLQTEGLPFKPQLSQTTIQLAQRKIHRKPAGAGARQQHVMENFFATKEAQELQECTFQPVISDQSRKLSQNKRLIPPPQQQQNDTHDDYNQPMDKCAELFEHAKHVIQAKQNVQDRTTEEVEFERAKDQCTFRPAIHQVPLPTKPNGGTQKDPVKGEFARQHYDRLSRAREERERVREITERGYSSKREDSANSRHQASVASNHILAKKQIRPATAANHKKVPSSAVSGQKKLNQDLRIPLLLVDIGIGNRKERIAVYEGDRADTLARDFCLRHGLDIENIAVRLQEEIERQIEMISLQQQQQQQTPKVSAAQQQQLPQ